jgi:pyridoxamine 5'-phosphate oxidase
MTLLLNFSVRLLLICRMKIESEFFTSQGDQAIWELLANHLKHRKAMQRMVLTSLDAEQKPQARTLVLRELDSETKCLYFFTDSRSTKVAQWQNNPYSQALAYCHEDLLQLRLTGVIEVLANGVAFMDALSQLKAHQYKDYRSAHAPGSLWRADSAGPADSLNFNVIKLQINQIEVLEIKPHAQEHLRWSHSYNSMGELIDTKRLVP